MTLGLVGDTAIVGQLRTVTFKFMNMVRGKVVNFLKDLEKVLEFWQIENLGIMPVSPTLNLLMCDEDFTKSLIQTIF